MAKNLAFIDLDDLEDQIEFVPIKKKPTTEQSKQPKKKKGHHSHEIVEYPEIDS